MMINLVFVGFLCCTVIQTLPSSELIPQDKQLPCDKKIAWYRNITEQTRKLYKEYYKTFITSKPKTNDLEKIEDEHDQIEKKISGLEEKYKNDSKELHQISNSTARLAFCQKEIEWYRLTNANLTKIATHLKSDVLSVLDKIGVSPETKMNFDKVLSRLVNFLFIIDISKSLLVDVVHLVKYCWTTVEEGVALENELTLTEEGVAEPLINVAADYDINVFDDNNELDNEITDDLIDFGDDTAIKVAGEQAAKVGAETGVEVGEDLIGAEGESVWARVLEFLESVPK